MATLGLRSLSNNQFLYSEGTGGQSSAAGIDSNTNNFKIVLSSTTGATPAGSAVVTMEPGANGNISLTPNGSGSVVISKATVQSGSIDNTAIGAVTASSVNASSYALNGVPVSFGGTTWVPVTDATPVSLNAGEGALVNTFSNASITLNAANDGDTFEIVINPSSSGYSVVGNSGQQFSLAGVVGTTLATGTLPYPNVRIVYIGGVFVVTNATSFVELT